MKRIRIKSLSGEAGTDLSVDVSRGSTRTRVEEWQKLLLRPDIHGCLTFSKLRCVISIVSIALLATDIPRSGLGVRRLGDCYQVPIMPDTVARFGPYDYPVRHIWRENDEFYGLEGDDPIDSAKVWSYQYDTTSVGLRGAVELLNVTAFPESLLYKGELGQQNNQGGILSLNSTFYMLDAFITAARAKVRARGKGPAVTPEVFRFATKIVWVDRVYQYLTQFVKSNRLWSLHTLHIPLISRHTRSLHVCRDTSRRSESLHPRFCSYPGIWKCAHPVNASLPAVHLSDQMDIRFQELQRRYPDLEIDVVLIATHRPSMTSGTLSYTYFNCEDQEIVVLTRGRRCAGNDTTSSECSTVFVDDYRYEREMLQTNVVDWYFFIAMMRGGAQGYFWIRLILLYRTAFIAADPLVVDEEQHWYARGMSAVLIVFKIPFQVVVYSSVLPVVGYVLALFLDGNFMDVFLDSYWSTLEGVTSIELMPFLNLAVTQMRSVWLMAFFVDLMVLVARKPINGSEEKLPGIRGLAISFTSALTIIGPYRRTEFRSTEIVSAIHLPAVGQRVDTVRAAPQLYFNESTYLFDNSTMMLVVCVGAVAVLASAARLIGFVLREDRGLVLISTLNVPFGTELLWPTSSLSIRFNTLASCTSYDHNPASSAKISPETQQGPAAALREPPRISWVHPNSDDLIVREGSCWTEWHQWHFCRSKRITDTPTNTRIPRPTGGLASRTTQSQSILQLMNIAMMTDPWNVFWLRVLGINLYLYRIRPAPGFTLVPYAVILPYCGDEMEERTGLSCDDFQLEDSLSSRVLPMATLLQSG